MRLIAWTLSFSLLVIAICTNVLAEDSSQQLTELVSQLGDESFAVREEATARLNQVGLPAREALLQGLEHDDPEVRRRCQRILIRILQVDYDQRIQQFRKSDSGGFGLEGWDRYEQLVGSDAVARELFLEMHEAEAGLLASAEVGSKEAARALELRFMQAFRGMQIPVNGKSQEPSVGTIATFLFVVTNSGLELPAAIVQSNYWNTLLQQKGFIEAATKGKLKVPLQRLLTVWCEMSATGIQAYQKLFVALRLELKAALPMAQKVYSDPKQPAIYRAAAIEVIARLGGKPYARMLLPALKDEEKIRQTSNRTTQVSDVALGWLIHLTGQEISDYSQPDAKRWFDTLKRYKGRYVGTNYSYFGYTDDKQRKQAYEKWSAWLKDHPLPELPED